ncbi:MAG: restriction endonuclease subunit S [Deltaproteobacteria bacterium]
MSEWNSITYPNEWVVNVLSDLCELITDGSHFSPIPQEDGEVIVNVKDMKIWGIDYNSCTKISKNDFDFLSKQNCAPKINDVLLSKDGTIGRVLVFKDNRKVVILSSIAILRTKPVLEPEYLSAILRSFIFERQLYRFQSGSALKRLVLRDIQKITIPYPLKNEQRKIARILSTIDAVIEKTQAAIAKHKAIKQGMLHDLFTRGIDITTGKLRPKYEDAPDLYKESILGIVPNAWDVEFLGNIISVSSGEGLTQNKIKPGVHPVYGGNGINGYHSEYLFEDEKLIIGRVGEYCGNAFITKAFSWVTDNALVVSNNEKGFNFDYWVAYLNYLDLNSVAFAAAQPVITGGIIGKVPITKVSSAEQNEIAVRLKTINEKLQSEQNYLHKLQSIKQGLMADLLSGKKRVKLPEEELLSVQ